MATRSVIPHIRWRRWRDNWKLRHVSRVLHTTRNIERTRKKVTRTFSVSSNWNFGENSRVCVYIYTRCLRSFDSPCIRFHQFCGRQWNVDCHWPDKIFVALELFEGIRKCSVLSIYSSNIWNVRNTRMILNLN